MAAGDDHVFVELFIEAAGQGLFGQIAVVIIARRAPQDVAVDDEDGALQRQDDQVLRQFLELFGGETLADFEHHLQPEHESLAVKPRFDARPVGGPQIRVEDALDLFRGCQADQIAAVLKADVVDQRAERVRRQRLHGCGHLRRVDDAFDELAGSRLVQPQGTRCHGRSRLVDPPLSHSRVLC